MKFGVSSEGLRQQEKWVLVQDDGFVSICNLKINRPPKNQEAGLVGES